MIDENTVFYLTFTVFFAKYFLVKQVNLYCSDLLMYMWEGEISAKLEEVNLLSV